MRHLLLVIAFGAIALQPADAADTPARLVVGKGSIEERLDLPRKLEPARYEIHCKLWITDQGGVRRNYCYSMPDWTQHESLRQAVEYASYSARFMPAKRDGVPIDVLASLMVIIDTRLVDDPLILAVLNNGVETARYGLLYLAPQRYGVLFFPEFKPQLHTGRPIVVWLETQIDEHGRIRDCQVTDKSRVTQGMASAIVAKASTFTFLPGYDSNGRPVPVRHVEPIVLRQN